MDFWFLDSILHFDRHLCPDKLMSLSNENYIQLPGSLNDDKMQIIIHKVRIIKTQEEKSNFIMNYFLSYAYHSTPALEVVREVVKEWKTIVVPYEKPRRVIDLSAYIFLGHFLWWKWKWLWPSFFLQLPPLQNRATLERGKKVEGGLRS